MLKIYNKRFLVSIDGAKWRPLSASGSVMLEESQVILESILFENLSFKECYDLLETHRVNGMYCDTTSILKTPRINISYSDTYYFVQYKRFKTISYKITHDEILHYSLSRIMERFPAEQTIQYLRERGIAALACPMLK